MEEKADCPDAVWNGDGPPVNGGFAGGVSPSARWKGLLETSVGKDCLELGEPGGGERVRVRREGGDGGSRWGAGAPLPPKG